MTTLRDRLASLTPQRLRGIRRGIEKESLRAQPGGQLALTPHPAALGSPLTHPHITTDFGESQLELLTGVHADVDAALAELTRIHQVVYHELAAAGGEMLWVSDFTTVIIAPFGDPMATFGHTRAPDG